MANRTKVIETLKQYFDKKGRVLNSQEYSRESDTPIRIQQVRNIFGSWNRMEKLLMARETRGAADPITDVNEVIAARDKALYDAAAQWREASENQNAKALREAEAQHIAEVLALNAATPEGANANKIAIGGPLPSEQPKFHRMGATVNIDPATREQTVVDVEPEIVDPALDTDPAEGGMTPTQLRDAVARSGEVGTSSVEVGHATDGGAQVDGAPLSAATALSGDESTGDTASKESPRTSSSAKVATDAKK